MGTYTPNYNLYMPSIGEQGWGELVSNNFEILDTNLNDLQIQIDTINTQIDTINTNIGDGTRVLFISTSPIINSENFGKYASYDGSVYIAQFGYTTIESMSKPPHSCRLMIISVSGDLIISGNIDTYPTTLQSETPPNSETTNTYTNTIKFSEILPFTLTYTANANNSQITMEYGDYLNFINNTNEYTKTYSLSIPHAITVGGYGQENVYKNGTAGTAENTCNGGGGGYRIDSINRIGGTGCIFGQYAGGNNNSHRNGYGYGDVASNKYRCGLVIIAFGNLTITGTITQIGGNGDRYNGGYGGGASSSGGGGAPVFIYYTGTYTNNGTINTAGGNKYYSNAGNGGAGGIKVTKISI